MNFLDSLLSSLSLSSNGDNSYLAPQLGAEGIAAQSAGINPLALMAGPAAIGLALANKKDTSGLGEMPYGNDLPDQGGLSGNMDAGTAAADPQSELNAPPVDSGLGKVVGSAIGGKSANSADDMPITITGDGWKPKKGNFLTFLADVVNHHYDNGLLASKLLERNNVQSALGDFTDDPLKAIKRLNRIPGQQGTALQLYNQYLDNKRADDLAQANIQAKQDRSRGVVASMMGSLNENNYDKLLPVIRRYAEARGLDASEIPDKYDPDLINTYRMGGMTVDQQIDNSRANTSVQSLQDYRQERLRQLQERLSQQGANTESQIKNRDIRTNEYLRRGREGGVDNNASLKAAKLRANRVFKDSRGLVEFDKTGNKMKVTSPDGKVYYYGINPKGQAVYVGNQ